MRIEDITGRWRGFPIAVTGALVALLLLAGILIVAQGESSYLAQEQRETHAQADILAASVAAALDFGDAAAARESVETLRVNPQIRMAAIYDRAGALVAGYAPEGTTPPGRIETTASSGADAIVSKAPVTRAGKQLGTALVAVDPQPFSTRLRRYLIVGLLVAMAALVAVILGLAQVTLGRANHELESRAAALTAANAELTHQINERAKAEEQLRQAQKMQALGQLTGGIAHDFNNLLTVIQGSADMLQRPGLAEDRRKRFADAIVEAASRAAALTSQLLAFARRQPLKPEVIDVNQMIAGMTELLDRALGERVIVETALVAEACTVEADRAQLVSAVLNIAVNARDAMPEGGTLRIATERREGEHSPMIALSVSDTGSGMDAATIERAMEPFFTTKAAGKGTGLGLSQVYGFASQSGGDLRIESTPGHGTRVTILLPGSDRASAAEQERRTVTGGDRTGSVLLVEDNEEVGEFAEALLRELGHSVVRARSGNEALEVARAARFDVVLSDVVMPGMSGLELAETLATACPALPVILTTGYSDEIARSGTGGRPVLLKPYRLDALASVIDDALRDGATAS
ncbi:signal transduction histidine kinase [Sphingomonas naasensis]|uniref:histidine kinase n=1 Tax=Sphingomonas naasensis TaxID=1344951 RepID=A0A4S1W4C7_9SPHN|nr:ATP-binding protein [Sphingomonas naasensis]NIJ19689.1 signal transduction histidine kinase [Sphingomonas naasensis]TGX37103.1 response regulator [Sphingomonas naasensis]